MLIRTTHEVGLLVRDRRRAAGLTQGELAERVGASREWIRQLESGKPRLELGLTLRALTALGIALNAEFAPAAKQADTPAPPTKAPRSSRGRG
jgi:HTH-type transcriptional regulator/antitoxin HipB